MGTLETGFVALSVFVLLGTAVGGVVVADDGEPTDRVTFDPDVRDVDSFEPTERDGTAVVDGTQYESVQSAVDAASPGDTVALEGRFEDERVVIRTPNVTLTSTDGFAVIDGGAGDSAAAPDDDDGSPDGKAPGDDGAVGEAVGSDSESSNDTVLSVDAPGVTLDGVWVRNSGLSATEQDAGIWVTDNGSDFRLVDSRITDITFGIWLHETDGALLRNNTIVGHEGVYPLAKRGNGIHLFYTSDVRMEENAITGVRDGIYFSWASESHAHGNYMWDLRFGVHYMYSDNCVLEGNVAFDNEVGFALMVSRNLEIVNNTAVNNTGPSGHGIQVLQIDDTVINGNKLVGNVHGVHLDNSQRITLEDNLLMENRRGAHITSGTRDAEVHGNSFVHNDRQAFTPMRAQKHWDGNYWSDARSADLTGDGTSEIRHRPEGLVEVIAYRNPEAAVFTNSPAFDAVRMAESSFPILESPGVVDNRPLVEAEHDWRRYYGD